ncbi:MAG TPA: XTP/dITP diphosphatase [Candidatus Scybalocola faecipullorum]|nr:XTP/dITP diphosphatase [Candidatus Scybalocola faecipullorum]
MKRIIFATGNEGKLREIRMILKDFPVEIVSMKEAGIDVDIDENGTTFEENALIKARTIMKMTGDIVLADDSGLEIDYFDGAPGVYSARFLGENTSYDVKNQYILDKMENVPEEKRTARFVCVMAAVFPDGTEVTRRGTIEGMIGYEIAGENGFGYDPIFFVPEYGCMSAQLEPDVKNEISHRGKALRALRDAIGDRLK